MQDFPNRFSSLGYGRVYEKKICKNSSFSLPGADILRVRISDWETTPGVAYPMINFFMVCTKLVITDQCA